MCICFSPPLCCRGLTQHLRPVGGGWTFIWCIDYSVGTKWKTVADSSLFCLPQWVFVTESHKVSRNELKWHNGNLPSCRCLCGNYTSDENNDCSQSITGTTPLFSLDHLIMVLPQISSGTGCWLGCISLPSLAPLCSCPQRPCTHPADWPGSHERDRRRDITYVCSLYSTLKEHWRRVILYSDTTKHKTALGRDKETEENFRNKT